MKKLPILLMIAALLIGCKPSIDSQLDKLEKQYAAGNNVASEQTWDKLWDRQGEMTLAQIERFVKLTEEYNPEWHYDDMDDDSDKCPVAAYMESRVDAAPTAAPQSNTIYDYYAPKLAYYECSNCGLVVKSEGAPTRANGVCHRRNGGTTLHIWQRIVEVGTKHIYSCRKCGLQLQADESPNAYTGTCKDGKKHTWNEDY